MKMNHNLFNRKLIRGITPIVACVLLSGFVVWWYLYLNRFLCLYYREQSQMFLFSWDYFLQYLGQPGGLTAYIASFLTQFFCFPVVGTFIYLLIFLGLYKMFRLVMDKFSLFENSFIVAFIPALLFLPASIHFQFDIAGELAVIFALSGFLLLTMFLRSRFYYLLIPLAISVFYVFVGGNVLLILILFALYSFYKQQKEYCKHLLTIVMSLLIPVTLWRLFYLISFNDACFALTPFRYQDTQWSDFRVIAWLSVAVVPIIGMLLKNVKAGRKWILSYNIGFGLIVLIMILKVHNPNTGNIVKMGYDAGNGNWENILALSKKATVSPFNCFYTNLALQKTGQLSEKMFHYDQIGASGLIIDMEDNFSCQAKSELFYRLGLINFAQYYTFESMIGYTTVKEPNIRNLKRLMECAVMKQDRKLAMKYEKILDKTLFYRNEAIKQDACPIPVKMKNMLTRDIPAILASIMDDNPKNQAVFEYLMAYYMLERDFGKAKNCFDRYFSNLSYPNIPTHYAELLLLYKRLNQLDDHFYEQYPISRNIRERFDMMDVLVSSQMNKKIKKTLEDGFMDTYWFYVRFPLVNIKTTPKDEKNIY